MSVFFFFFWSQQENIGEITLKPLSGPIDLRPLSFEGIRLIMDGPHRIILLLPLQYVNALIAMELVWILVEMELAWMLRPSQGTKKLTFGLFRELWPLALNSLLDPYVKARFLCGSYKTRTDAGRDKDIRGRNSER